MKEETPINNYLCLTDDRSQYIIESFLLKMSIKYNYVLYSPSNKEIFDRS